MNNSENCRNCGEKRPTDAPVGLCPACLLKSGVSAGDAGPEGATILFGPVSSSVVEAFGEVFGKIPQVLLRDADSVTSPGPVIRPLSDEIPGPTERCARLQLFGEIARGGMGAVLKGRDADLGRDLAVKILLESHRDKPEMVRRFIEEAQIAGQLQHPGVVPVYELGAFGDHRPYFAMKLVKGHTLAEILADRKSPSDQLPRLLSIFESICQTMAYAHARGVIHRDLKPSNVMVGSFGEVQVMDWGLAKVLPRGGVVDDASAGHAKEQATLISTARSGTDSDLSQAGSVMGTPAYMAPEQARGDVEDIDERADVFALGSMFCEFLTGQPAFSGRNSGEILRKAARGELADAMNRLDQADLSHDPELIVLAKSCLCPERDERPRHAGEIAARMSSYHLRVQERLRNSEIERAEAKARAEEATRRVTVERQRIRLIVALAASLLGLIVLGGGTGFWVYQEHQARATSLKTTLARIQTLQEQAAADGAESPRRREALVAAELALVSLGDLSQSELGLRLTSLRDELKSEQQQADRGQQLLAALTDIQVTNVDSGNDAKNRHIADDLFSEAFRQLQLNLDTEPEAAVAEIRKIPPQIVPELVNNLDRWLIIRHELAEPETRSVRGILTVIQNLDSDPERNRLRSLLLESDLKPFLKSLQNSASQATLLDSGPEMPLVLSRLLAQADDTELATAVLRKSVIRYPGDPATNMELARILEGDDAIRYYTVARAFAPEMGAELASELEDKKTDVASAEAIAIRQELCRVDSGNVLQLFWLHRSLLDSGQDLEADKTRIRIDTVLSDMVRRAPHDPVACGQRAVMYMILFDREKALESLREVCRIDPSDAQFHYWFALMLSENGQHDECARELRAAIQCAPLNGEYHKALGAALRAISNKAGAIGEFREAIRLETHLQSEKTEAQHPTTADTVLDQLDSRTAGFFQGVLTVKEEFHQDPGWSLGPSADLHELLSEVLAETGDIGGAIEACRDGLQRRPDMLELHETLARLLKVRGLNDEASLEFEIVIGKIRQQLQSDPMNAQLTERLAGLLEQQGKATESITVYREAIKAQPKSLELHQGLAELLERQHRITESDPEFDLVIALLREQLQAKEEAWILRELGMMLLRRGQTQDALAQFRRILELDPKAFEVCNGIAWDLATNSNAKLRNGEISLEFATKACELTEWKNAGFIDTLAAGYALCGDFDAAVKWQAKAIELESDWKNRNDYGTRLKLYQEKQPFHSSTPPE